MSQVWKPDQLVDQLRAVVLPPASVLALASANVSSASTFLAHLYESTCKAVAVTMALVLLKMFKFLVKVFKSIYLLNLWMDLVDILPDVRYWSEVL